MTTKRLRPVEPDERAIPKRAMRLLEAVEDGTVRDQAVALRRRIAEKIEDPTCPVRELASLSKRVIELTTIIERYDAANGEVHEDEAAPDEAFDTASL